MNQQNFIAAMLQKGNEAIVKVVQSFSALSANQLNWKPDAKSWSIAQCLHHLAISDSNYFSMLEKITTGTYQMSFWEKYNPLSGIMGRMFVNMVQEQPRRKIPAPSIVNPQQSDYTKEILTYYLENLKCFMEYVSKCSEVDVSKVIITSPLAGAVTYPLKDALQLLFQHEHRHINQAIRLLENPSFPKE